MFTGIIEEVGTVERAGARMSLRCARVLEGLKTGDSVAVNGVCLTVVKVGAGSFEADVSPETLDRTSLGELRPGALVNLERAMSPSGRLGGHIVQGHVDATGQVTALEPLRDGNWLLSVRFPDEIARYVVFKGSIAIDGISLTISRVDAGVLSAAVIPHTYANTNLRARRVGDRVNLEADILAKYVERMLSAYAPSGLTEQKLRDLGY
ncbi:MAG: riboflavin synthase [bacterium]|jgi:riboflavin synthase